MGNTAAFIRRARVMAVVKIGLDMLVIGGVALTIPTGRPILFSLALVDILLTLLYIRWAERSPTLSTYAVLLASALLITAGTFISGHIAGISWVLYLPLPPIAGLVLSRPRVTFPLALLVGLIMLAGGITQIQTLSLLLPPELLYYALAYDLGVMVALSALTELIITQLVKARHQAEQRAEELKETAQEKNRLIAELEALTRRQEQLLETVRQLSTPLIPVLKGISVLPLIGAVDPERLERLTPELLRGIREQQARVVIMDVTAVPGMDQATALALLKTVRAVSLLGTEFVLTGIRSTLAQDLINAGIDLAAIPTRTDLRRGIEYAQARLEG